MFLFLWRVVSFSEGWLAVYMNIRHYMFWKVKCSGWARLAGTWAVNIGRCGQIKFGICYVKSMVHSIPCLDYICQQKMVQCNLWRTLKALFKTYLVWIRTWYSFILGYKKQPTNQDVKKNPKVSCRMEVGYLWSYLQRNGDALSRVHQWKGTDCSDV